MALSKGVNRQWPSRRALTPSPPSGAERVGVRWGKHRRPARTLQNTIQALDHISKSLSARRSLRAAGIRLCTALSAVPHLTPALPAPTGEEGVFSRTRR